VWEMLTGALLSSGENTTRVNIYVYKAKVNISRYRAGVSRGIALLFHDHSTRRFEWAEARPGRYLSH